ncbi:MAG: HEAT repeat domain-containing protein [Planctomycetes bacterium]|nr:HEAT repeat domain-containing protein [Planctomycetota bacterium]
MNEIHETDGKRFARFLLASIVGLLLGWSTWRIVRQVPADAATTLATELEASSRSTPSSSEPVDGMTQNGTRLDTPNRLADARWVDGPFGAARGRRFRYGLSSSTEFGLHAATSATATGISTSGSDKVRIAFEGESTITIEDRDARSVLVTLVTQKFRFVDTSAKDAGLEEFAQAMHAPTRIRLDVDGRPTGLAFRDDVSSECRDFVRNAVSLFFYGAGQEGVGTWRDEARFETQESDATGRYRASWIACSPSDGRPRYDRTKREYIAMNAAVRSVPPHDLRGHTTLTFDRSLHWLESAVIDEQVSMQTPELEVRIATITTASVRLLEATTVDDEELVSLSSIPESAFESPGGDGQSGELTPRERLAQLASEYEGKRVDDMLGALRDALAQHGIDSQEAYDAWRRLGEFLEVHPELCKGVVHMIESGGATGDFGGMLISALGAAGNDNAQDALAALSTSNSLPPEARQHAIVASHQVAIPNAALLESLRGTLEQSGEFSGTVGASALAFGTLSGRSVDTLKNGKSPLETLFALENAAARGGWLDTWLEALGNVGTAAVFDTLVRYCTHTDEGLRAVAARVLGRNPDPRVIDVLSSRVQIETSDVARQALADALGDRPTGVADELLRGLARDRSVAVQWRAITQLGKRSEVVENVTLLRALAASPELDPEVQKLVRELLDAIDKRN